MLATLLGLYLTSVIVPITGKPVPLTVHPIEKFEYFGTRTRFGKLEFRGGLVISSTERNFGGLSGIDMLPGGREAVIVSDLGYLMRAKLEYQAGLLTGIAIPHMTPALPGISLKRKDVEDVAIGNNGEIFVTLERNKKQIAVRKFRDNALGRPRLQALPGAGSKLGFNKGLESIALIPAGSVHAGRMLAIAERPKNRSGNAIPCWIIGVGTCSIEKRDGFEITSARFLPNRDLLILERRLAPGLDLAARLRRIPAHRFGGNEMMNGEVIMEADLSMQIDNMEGLAVHQDDNGSTIITLVSDDNLNFFQRTLILQFALLDDLPD